MAHTFDAEVVTAICTYMNDASMEATLGAIAEKARPDLAGKRALLVGFDGDGMDLELATDAGPELVHVDWTRPITERGEVREQLFALYERAVFGY